MKLGCIDSYERKRIAGKKKVNAFKDGFLIFKTYDKIILDEVLKFIFFYVATFYTKTYKKLY